jgi:hypothetical protein
VEERGEQLDSTSVYVFFLNYFEKIVAPSFEGRHSKPGAFVL